MGQVGCSKNWCLNTSHDSNKWRGIKIKEIFVFWEKFGEEISNTRRAPSKNIKIKIKKQRGIDETKRDKRLVAKANTREGEERYKLIQLA